eukprot:TRINITY_DN3584_c0_g1_i1.p1 TRINITY_DN3584_c0_g1~~TRINITY_DN3584_c0_g1_i1.p1  ORF type:complete len:483 (-),score=113.73 TRINITY_DN3584_c0_g1_i1:856-2223(-)
MGKLVRQPAPDKPVMRNFVSSVREPLNRGSRSKAKYTQIGDVEGGYGSRQATRFEPSEGPTSIEAYAPLNFDASKGYKSEGGSPSARQRESFPLYESKARMPKRGGRRRIRRKLISEKGRVSSYCISNELKIEPLLEYLKGKPNRKVPRKGVSGNGAVSREEPMVLWADVLYSDVIHSTTDKLLTEEPAEDYATKEGDENAEDSQAETDRESKYARDREREHERSQHSLLAVPSHIGKDMFILPYGCIIFWGFTPAEELKLLSEIRKFAVGPVSESELEQSQDDMTFCFVDAGDDKESRVIKADELVLSTDSALEKLSYSFALAQSAKLFVFEERLGNIIEQTRVYPEELKLTGKIQLTQMQMNKLIGRVLVERNEVNLHSDVLDKPEFFWETQTWEPEYQRLCTYLDMPLRLVVINKRLDVLRELLDVLHNQVTNTHAIRLEVTAKPPRRSIRH